YLRASSRVSIFYLVLSYFDTSHHKNHIKRLGNIPISSTILLHFEVSLRKKFNSKGLLLFFCVYTCFDYKIAYRLNLGGIAMHTGLPAIHEQ
ncbi:hypothetical protein ACJX0J_040242, partial [Zea mays]